MLIKEFDNSFKQRLVSAISEVENASNAELVFLVKEVSGNYRDTHLIFASLLSLLSFSLFIFLPVLFGDYLIYAGTILTFFVGLLLSFFIPSISKLFTKKDILNKNVEIMARAHFQKGKIYNTKSHTGVLIYCSLFEKQIYILADKGIKGLIPSNEFIKIEKDFNNVFVDNKITENILVQINQLKPIFAKYIPPVENDINELADDMEIII